MRRFLSYVLLSAYVLAGVAVAASPVIKAADADLAYSSGKTLYFKASKLDEGSLTGNYGDEEGNFLGESDADASGKHAIEYLAETVRGRLDNWGVSEYAVRTQGYDTIAVDVRAPGNSSATYTYLESYLAFSGQNYELDASNITYNDYPDSDLWKEMLDDQTARIEEIEMGTGVQVPVVVMPLKEGEKYQTAFRDLLKYCEDNTSEAEKDEEGNETSPAKTTSVVIWANRADTDSYDNAEKDPNVGSHVLATVAPDNAKWMSSSDKEKTNESEQTWQLQIVPNSSAFNSDGQYDASKSTLAYEAAVYLRNMLNAEKLSYTFSGTTNNYFLSYTYSRTIEASVEPLLTLGNWFTYPAMGKTMIALLVSLLLLAVGLALFEKVGALAGLASVTLSVFSAYAVFVAFGVQFNIAALLGMLGTALVALFGYLFYSSRLKDQLYQGRTLKKANSEAAKSSLWPTIDAGVVTIILGVFVYIFAGDLASKAGTMLVLGGFFATLVNLLLTRILFWFLCNDDGMQGKFPRRLGVNADKIPDLLKEEKQSYFGPYHEKDFSKGKLPVLIVTCLFILAGIGSMIGFGVTNSGNVYNDAASRQNSTVLRIDVKSTDSTMITGTSAANDFNNISALQGEGNFLQSVKIDDVVLEKMIADDGITLSETPKTVYKTPESGDGTSEYWFYYEIPFKDYVDPNVSHKVSLYEESTWSDVTTSDTKSLSDAISNHIQDSFIPEESDFKANIAVTIPEVSQPYLGKVALGLGVGLAVAALYMVIRFRPGKGLAASILAAAAAYSTTAFFVFTRLPVTPVVAIGSLISAILVFLGFEFILASSKDVEKENKDKEKSSLEVKIEALYEATKREAGNIMLFSLIAAYLALIFFAFGPNVYAMPYLNVLLGVLFAVAFALTLLPWCSALLMKLFSKIKFKPLKRKKKAKTGQIMKKKGSEAEEAIFIGIND